MFNKKNMMETYWKNISLSFQKFLFFQKSKLLNYYKLKKI